MYPVYDEGGHLMAIFDSKESMQKMLSCEFDSTTEGATQTDRVGEQHDEVG